MLFHVYIVKIDLVIRQIWKPNSVKTTNANAVIFIKTGGKFMIDKITITLLSRLTSFTIHAAHCTRGTDWPLHYFPCQNDLLFYSLLSQRSDLLTFVQFTVWSVKGICLIEPCPSASFFSCSLKLLCSCSSSSASCWQCSTSVSCSGSCQANCCCRRCSPTDPINGTRSSGKWLKYW